MRIPLLYCGNKSVFGGMVISLLSITKHCKEPLDVFLMTMDLREIDPVYLPISEEQRVYLETICYLANSESRVTLLECGDLYRESLLNSPGQENRYTPYTFLRLYADRFPQIPDKLIYLDTDTVAVGNVSELYRQELDGAELGGIRDYYGCHFFGVNYFNAGVLLLDLAKIRETGLFRRSLELCATKKLFLNDQSALNRLVKQKKILPRKFNEQKKIREDTVIRHFSMTIRWIPFRTRNIKPWNVDEVRNVLHVTEIDDILNDYLTRKPGFPD